MKCEVTLYDILEISPHASDAVIRAAYRCLAQTHHPDKNSGDALASERQARINDAYSILSDPVKRRRYDQARELHERFVERRGAEVPTRTRSRADAAKHQGLRAFVFRPLA